MSGLTAWREGHQAVAWCVDVSADDDDGSRVL